MRYFLGIFGGQGPNPAAALLREGDLVAFCEEERFSRIKGAPNALPINSILYCLNLANIGLDDVEKIGFGWDCERYITETAVYLKKLRDGYEFSDPYNKLHEERLLINFDPLKIKMDLTFALAKHGLKLDQNKIKFFQHHLCHAASSFYCSGFKEASILTLDGSGEEYSCVLWTGIGKEIREVRNFKLPNSLGGYYATFTEFLGFKADEEEGKLMGLAPYGVYSEDLQDKLSKVLGYDAASGDFWVDPTMRFVGRRSFGQRYTDKLVALFGQPRLRNQALTQWHKDIAYNVQWRLEQVAVALVTDLVNATGLSNVCLSGGVAMNCKMNGVLAQLPSVAEIFVQPASSDSGTALGAAYLAAQSQGISAFAKFNHAYWGSQYDDTQIESALKEAKLGYRRSDDIAQETARYLSRGLIVGWFQGATEIGARALGNRSILANPMFESMKEKLNLQVKHREDWRPFCPSLTAAEYERFFPKLPHSDFMILAFPVNGSMRRFIPGAVHVDGSARPQRVAAEHNPLFHSLLVEFGKLAGHEVLINTSFNVQGEPIVNSPRDAIRCFGGTGLDVLAIGNFIVTKSVERSLN